MRRFFLRFDPHGAMPSSEPAPHRIDGLDIFWSGYAGDATGGAPEPPERLFARAFRSWGEELSKHVDGQYAVAIVDRERSALFLTHDEFGICPLYYARDGAAMLAATHLEDLVAEIGIGELDERYVGDFLFDQHHYGERTPYARIKRLRFAECLTFDAGGSALRRTWTIDAVRPMRAPAAAEYETGLRAEVARAVANARSADGLTWCELSGGLDSSTVFAAAMLDGAWKLEAFSLRYPGAKDADELRYIESMLGRYPAPAHALDATAHKPFATLPERFCAVPRVGLVAEGWAARYGEMLVAAGVDVVLTGQGGDAVFLGDNPEPFVLADILGVAGLLKLPWSLRAYGAASRQKRSPTWLFTRYVVQSIVRKARGIPLTYDAQRAPWLSPAFEKRAGVRERARQTFLPEIASVADRAYLELVLRSADACSTHDSERDAGARFRHPLLAPHLVRYMLAVPWEEKLHPDIDRLLQRRAYERVLPRDVVLRKTKARPDELFYAGLSESDGTYRLLHDRPQIVERGYVDRAGWQKAISLARVGSVHDIRWILSAAALEIWLTRLDAFAPKRPRLSPRPVS